MSANIPDIEPFNEFLDWLWGGAISPIYGVGDKTRDTLMAQGLPTYHSIVDFQVAGGPPGKMTTESFFKRVEEALNSEGHVAGPRVAQALVFPMAYIRTNSCSPVARLNFILEKISDFTLSQYQVYKVPAPADYQYRMGKFYIGRLRSEKLRYRCRRACSDYYELYGAALEGKYSVEREFKPVRALDWISFIKDVVRGAKITDADCFQAAVLCYYESLAEVLFENMLEELVEEQNLPAALDGPVMFEERGRFSEAEKNIIGFVRISVFWRRTNGAGYVVPIRASANIIFDLCAAHIRIPAILKEVEEQYQLASLGHTALHETIRVYARFMVKARMRAFNKQVDDAFLHYVICLDLLFGKAGNLNQSIASRAAVATFQHFSRSYADQVKQVSELYDIRSKYVHRGEHIDEAKLQQVEQICKEVLRCLLRLNRNARHDDETLVEDWIKKLDHLSTGIQASEPVPVSLFTDWGISLGERSQTTIH